MDDARRDSLPPWPPTPTLAALWEWFIAYDEATLPLRDLLPGENDDIEVLRVSPRDTWRLVDDPVAAPSWPAPRCITSAASSAPTGGATTSCGAVSTPPSDSSARCGRPGPTGGARRPDRRGPRRRSSPTSCGPRVPGVAQRARRPARPARRRPERSPCPPPRSPAVIAAIEENYRPPPPAPGPGRDGGAAPPGRRRCGPGTPVAPGPLRQVRTWLGRIVQVAAGLVEVALPNRARSIVGRHLLDVAVIAAILMIVLGGLVGGPGVTSFGWVVLLTVVGVRLAIGLLARWLTPGGGSSGPASRGRGGRRRARRLRAAVVERLAPRRRPARSRASAPGCCSASCSPAAAEGTKARPAPPTARPAGRWRPSPSASSWCSAVAGASVGHGHNELRRPHLPHGRQLVPHRHRPRRRRQLPTRRGHPLTQGRCHHK